jgi:hypothetical protein
MAPPHTVQLTGRADWALMITVHDALRRDLDQLLHSAVSHASARARWGTFRSQLRFMIDDAFTIRADPGRLRQLLARLRARLASHLAHEEADALPLISQTLSPGELGGVAAAIRGGHSTRRAGTTLPWALAGARPDLRERVLNQLPAPTHLLYRTVWLPRYARTTPPL